MKQLFLAVCMLLSVSMFAQQNYLASFAVNKTKTTEAKNVPTIENLNATAKLSKNLNHVKFLATVKPEQYYKVYKVTGNVCQAVMMCGPICCYCSSCACLTMTYSVTPTFPYINVISITEATGCTNTCNYNPVTCSTNVTSEDLIVQWILDNIENGVPVFPSDPL